MSSGRSPRRVGWACPISPTWAITASASPACRSITDKVYSEALAIRRDLAARDPSAYRPTVATTLNNLGILYSNTGRLAEADKAFSEALTIYRDLMSSNPTKYEGQIASLTKLLATIRGKSSEPYPDPAQH